MRTFVKEYTYPNGDLQCVQVAALDRWEDLSFLQLPYAEESLTCFSDIYRNFLVPACPWLFGDMVMFRIPEDMEVPFPFETKKYGTVADPLTAAAAAMEKGVRIRKGRPVFSCESVKAFWETLENRDCIRIIEQEHQSAMVTGDDDLMRVREKMKERKGFK